MNVVCRWTIVMPMQHAVTLLVVSPVLVTLGIMATASYAQHILVRQLRLGRHAVRVSHKPPEPWMITVPLVTLATPYQAPNV